MAFHIQGRTSSFFFSVAATLRVQSCKMNVAVFSSSSLLLWSLVCSWTAVGHTFYLAFCRSRAFCSMFLALCSSGQQLQVGDGASFIWLNLWALSWLWPVHNLLTTTCCHRLRKWKSSLSVRCPKAALMRVLFSWKVTLLCRQPGLCVSSMSSFLLCSQLYCCLVCVSHLCPPSCCEGSSVIAWFVCLIRVLSVVQSALSLPGFCVSSLSSFLLCRQLCHCLVCVSYLCPSCCAVSCIVAWFVCLIFVLLPVVKAALSLPGLCVSSVSFLLCSQLYRCLVSVSHLCPPSCCADSSVIAWFVCLIYVLPVVQSAVLLPGLCVLSMSFLLCSQLCCCLVCVSYLCPSCCADSCVVAWFVCLIYVLPVVQTALSLPGLCVLSMSFLLCSQLYHCLVCVFQKVQPCWPFPPTACERSATPSCRCCTSCTRLFLSHRYSLSSCSLDHFIISITQVQP